MSVDEVIKIRSCNFFALMLKLLRELAVSIYKSISIDDASCYFIYVWMAVFSGVVSLHELQALMLPFNAYNTFCGLE